MRSAKAELAKAEAQLATTKATEERQRTLITSDATTKQTLDNAEQARAGVEASVAHAQANLTKAIEQRGYAQLKAEFAGVVTAVGAEVGQVVSPGQNVVTVARPDIREAVVDIGEDFPVPLEIGLPFTVGLQLLPAVQVEGRIREIAPQADPLTRLRRVRIALNDPPRQLPAWVRPSRRSSAKSKTRSCACPRRRCSPGMTPISSGSSISRRARCRCTGSILPWTRLALASTGGLVPGTRIVTAGIHSLKQGQQVRIEQDKQP